IKKGCKKDVLIERMLAILDQDDSKRGKLDRLLKEIEDTQLPKSEGQHHKLYKSHFNAIDLFDRDAAKFRCRFRTLDWHSKFFYQLLQMLMNNAWTLYNEF